MFKNMAFQFVVAVVNVLLLLLKILAYVLVKRSFLLMMVIDNLADMIFSLILTIPESRFCRRRYSKVICCRFMQLVQFIPVLMFTSNLRGYSPIQNRQFSPYLVSIVILAVQLVTKSVLYGCFKNKNFSKESSDYLLLQDQVYDVFCTLPGLLSLMLIISLDKNDESIIDYVTTVILFALTISFWERTLFKIEKPKFESLHSTLSNKIGGTRSSESLDNSVSVTNSSKGSLHEERKVAEDGATIETNLRTPSPQFGKEGKDNEINKVMEMV